MHFLKKTKTVAFLIIRSDTLLYEQYSGGYSMSSMVPSFSKAKSFVSMLMGIAIGEGYINNVNKSITNYLPELTDSGFRKITIRNLLNLRSGIGFNEGYLNPFADVAKYYYGVNPGKYITKPRVSNNPDKKFKYRSVNTQAAGCDCGKGNKQTACRLYGGESMEI